MAPRKKQKEAGSLDAIKNYDYQRTKIVDKDGKTRHSASNGDAVAKAMLIYTAAGGDLTALIKKNGLGDRLDPSKWDNQGLFRMALGNSLRALVRAGTPVTIGDVEVKTLAQRVAVPEVVEKKARARKKAA